MRTSLNVPDDVLAAFDDVADAEGFDSRSRAVREAMQEYVERHTRLEDAAGDVTAVVAYDYLHDDVVGQLHRVQHDYQDVITTTSHVHREGWCLETAFCAGDAARVRELVYRLRDFDEVQRVRVLSLVADGSQNGDDESHDDDGHSDESDGHGHSHGDDGDDGHSHGRSDA